MIVPEVQVTRSQRCRRSFFSEPEPIYVSLTVAVIINFKLQEARQIVNWHFWCVSSGFKNKYCFSTGGTIMMVMILRNLW